MIWRRVIEMLRQGMTLDQVEARLESERRAELVALNQEHRRRMWTEIYVPFAVGMVSIAWCVGVIFNGGSQWLAFASLPGIAWCQWKLGKFWA